MLSFESCVVENKIWEHSGPRSSRKHSKLEKSNCGQSHTNVEVFGYLFEHVVICNFEADVGQQPLAYQPFWHEQAAREVIGLFFAMRARRAIRHRITL